MGTAAEEEIKEQLLIDIDSPSPPPASPGAVKMSVRRLCKAAEATGEAILRGVSMEVPAGQVVGIIGPSGGGKSTLLRALNRLWEPPAGAVFLDGADIRCLDVLSLRRRVGMLFQLPALFEGTVADNVRYGPQLRGKKLTELEVLLLDEPTSALDPISTQNIEDAIVRLKRSQGMTVVIVSHSVKQVQRIADVVCLLVDGEVVEVLPPSHLSQAQHPMARRFLELSG